MVEIDEFRRLVVKIGSSLLVDRERGLRLDWLNALAEDIAGLRAHSKEVMVVSSGAIALGRTALGVEPGGLKLPESQACAAVGQILLSRAWSQALSAQNIQAGQILLTLGDTQERRRYLNARETIATLLKFGAIPIVNENDTVATSEIRYGDNDRLAARVATMAGADLLVLLSDVDGFYTGIPGHDPDAKRLEHIHEITPEIMAMAGDAGTELSRGGMVTKLEAGRIATQAGCAMAIASGHGDHALAKLLDGGTATWFTPKEASVTARKQWIAGQLQRAGEIHVDAGAVKALENGSSLLPAGATRVEGMFSRGDTVAIIGPDGTELGCGLAAYDHGEARQVLGKKSDAVFKILGLSTRGEMIHRDNLSLHQAHNQGKAHA